MKYSKSAIGLLTAQYRSVLKKCWMINVGLFALGGALLTATPAEALDVYTTGAYTSSGTVDVYHEGTSGNPGTYTATNVQLWNSVMKIGTVNLTSADVIAALGDTPVNKAYADESGNNIKSTYATKTALNDYIMTATADGKYATKTALSNLVAGTDAFTKLKIGGATIQDSDEGPLSINKGLQLNGTSPALTIGNTSLSDGTLTLGGVDLTADTNGALNTSHMVATTDLKIGSSAAMTGVDTAVTSGHSTQLITSGAVYAKIYEVLGDATGYTPTASSAAEDYYGSSVDTVAKALDKVGGDVGTLTGTGANSVSGKITKAFSDNKAADINATGDKWVSAATVKAYVDEQDTSLDGRLDILEGDATVTGSVAKKIADGLEAERTAGAVADGNAYLVTGDKVFDYIADVKTEVSKFTADASLVTSGKIYSGIADASNKVGIGDALNAAGTQIEANKSAITTLNGTGAGSVDQKITDQAENAAYTSATSYAANTIGGQLKTNTQAITDLNAGKTAEGSVSYKIDHEAAKAAYNASADDYTAGTIGKAIQDNTTNISANTTALAGLKLSDGTATTTVQAAIDSARKGVATKTLNIGEDASKVVVGTELKSLTVGGDSTTLINKASNTATIAGKFTMDANGNIGLGAESGGNIHGIEISNSGNTVTFKGTGSTDVASITDGALTAKSATLGGLTLNGSSGVSVDKISSAAAITGTPDNDTLATTAAVKATVDTVSSALNDYATKIDVFGDATHAATLGKDAVNASLGSADVASGASVNVVNDTADSASMEVRTAAGKKNAVSVDAASIKIGNTNGDNFDGISYNSSTGAITMGSGSNIVTATGGALTATGNITSNATVKGATLEATTGLKIGSNTAASIDADGTGASTTTVPTTIDLATTKTVWNAVKDAKDAVTAYDNTTSGYTATTVQGAIDEAAVKIAANKTKSEANETKLAGLKMYDGTTAADTVQEALADYKTNLLQDSADKVAALKNTEVKANADAIALLNDTDDTKAGSVLKMIKDNAAGATYSGTTTIADAISANATAISNLGTASARNVVVPTTTDPLPTTDAQIETWVAGHALDIADVGTTFAVFGTKLTAVQADLMDTTNNESSIANALNGGTKDGTSLVGMVQKLAVNAPYSATATYDEGSIGEAVQNNTAKFGDLGTNTVAQAIAAAGTAADGKYVAKDDLKGSITIGKVFDDAAINNDASNVSIDTAAATRSIKATVRNNNAEEQTLTLNNTANDQGLDVGYTKYNIDGSVNETKNVNINKGNVTADGAVKAASFQLGTNDVTSIDSGAALSYAADATDADKKVMATDAAVINTVRALATTEVKANTDAITKLNGTVGTEGSVLYSINENADGAKHGATTIGDAITANTTKLAGLTNDTVQESINAAKSGLDNRINKVLNASNAVYNTVTGTNGTALLFNENDGGGHMFTTNGDAPLKSFVGVNDGSNSAAGGAPINALMYVRDPSTSVGTALSMNKDGLYYSKNKDTHLFTAKDEVVTLETAQNADYTEPTDARTSIGGANTIQGAIDAVAAATDTNTTNIATNTQAITKLNSAKTVEGSVDYKVYNDAKDADYDGTYTIAEAIANAGGAVDKLINGVTPFNTLNVDGMKVNGDSDVFKIQNSESKTVSQLTGTGYYLYSDGKQYFAARNDGMKLLDAEGNTAFKVTSATGDVEANGTLKLGTGADAQTLDAAGIKQISTNAARFEGGANLPEFTDGQTVADYVDANAEKATFTDSADAHDSVGSATTIGGAMQNIAGAVDANTDKLAGLKKADQTDAATVQDAIVSYAEAGDAALDDVLNGTTKFTKAKIGDNWSIKENSGGNFTLRDEGANKAVMVISKGGTFSLAKVNDDGSAETYFTINDGNVTANGTLKLRDDSDANSQTLNAAKIKQITTNQTNIGDMSALKGDSNAMMDYSGATPVAATTLVQAANNLSATLGTIHGLAATMAQRDQDEQTGTWYQNGAGNLYQGSEVDDHLAQLAASIGERNYANTDVYGTTAVPYLIANESVATSLVALARNLKTVADDYVTKDYFNNGDATNNAISMGSGAKDITIGSATNNVVVDNANHTIGATIDTRDADEVLSTLTMDNTNGVKLATTKGLGSAAKTKNVAINNGVVTADDSFVASDTAEGTSSTIKSDGSATFVGATKTASITDGDITADDINATTVTATTVTGTTVNATTLAMAAGGEATAIDNAGTVMTAAPTDDGKTLASTLTVWNNIQDATTVEAATRGNYGAGSIKNAVASIDTNMGNLAWYNGTHYANTGSTKTSLAAAIKNMDAAIYGKLGDMDLTTATHYANPTASTTLDVTNAIKNIDTNVYAAIGDLDNKYVTKTYFSAGDANNLIWMGDAASDIRIGTKKTVSGTDSLNSGVEVLADATNGDSVIVKASGATASTGITVKAGDGTTANPAAIEIGTVGTDFTGIKVTENGKTVTFKGTNKDVAIVDGAVTAAGDVTAANFVTAGNVTAAGTVQATKLELSDGAATPTITEATSIDNAGKDVLASGVAHSGTELASTETVYNSVYNAIQIGAAANGNYAAGTLQEAAAGLDAAIGNRHTYTSSHYANPTSDDKDLSTAIKNLDTALFNVTEDYVTKTYFNGGDDTKHYISMGSLAKKVTIGADDSARIVLDVETAGSENITLTAGTDMQVAVNGTEITIGDKDGQGIKVDNGGLTTTFAGSTAAKKVVVNEGVVTASDGVVVGDKTGTEYVEIEDDEATFKGANGTVTIADGTVTANKFAFDATHYATGIDNTGGVFTAAPADNYTIATTKTVYDNTYLTAAGTRGNYAAGSVLNAVKSIDTYMGDLTWYNGTHYANTGSTKTSLAAAIKNMDTAIYGKLGNMDLTTATNYANKTAATDLTVTDAIKNIDTNVKSAIDELDGKFVTKAYFSGGEQDTTSPNAGRIIMGDTADKITIGRTTTSAGVTNLTNGLEIDATTGNVVMGKQSITNNVASLEAGVKVSADTGTVEIVSVDTTQNSSNGISVDKDIVKIGTTSNGKFDGVSIADGVMTNINSADANKKSTVSSEAVVVTDGTNTSSMAASGMAVAGANGTTLIGAGAISASDGTNTASLDKTGVAVTDGSNTSSMSATGMAVTDGSNTSSMSATGVAVTNGTDTTLIGAGAISLTDTDNTTGLSSTGLSVVDENNNQTLVGATGMSVTNGADTTTIAAGSVTTKEVITDKLTLAGNSATAIDQGTTLDPKEAITDTDKATLATNATVKASVNGIVADIEGQIHGDSTTHKDIKLGDLAETTTIGKVSTDTTDPLNTNIKVDAVNNKITLETADISTDKQTKTGIEVDNKNQTIGITSASDKLGTETGLKITNEGTSDQHLIELTYTHSGQSGDLEEERGLIMDADEQTYSLGSNDVKNGTFSGLDIDGSTNTYALGKGTVDATTGDLTLDYGMAMDATNGVTSFADKDGKGVTMNKGDMTVTDSATVGSVDATSGALTGVKLDKSGTAQASESVTVGQVKADGSLDGNGVQMKNDGSAKFSATEGAVTVEKGGVIADNNVTVGDKSGANYIDMAKQTDGSLKATFASADGNVEIAGGNVTADNKVTAKDIEAKNSIYVGDPAGAVTAMYKTGIVSKADDNNQSTYGTAGMWTKAGDNEATLGGTGLSVTNGTATAGVSATGMSAENGDKKAYYSNDGIWIENTTTKHANLNEAGLGLVDGDKSASYGIGGLFVTDGTDSSSVGPSGIYTSKDMYAEGAVNGKDLVARESFTLAGTQVHSIDTGAAKSAPSADALATTASIYRNAEDGLYTPASGTYTTANAATINEALKALDNIVGDFPDGLNYENHNLDNGGTATPETIVDAFNNIDATMGTIHGLADKRKAAGTYKGNLAEGTTIEMHLGALDDAIGDRTTITNENGSNGYAFSTDTMYVADVLTDLASQIGTAQHLGEEKNGVSSKNTVNQNIAALNSVIGDVSELKDATYAQGDTLVESIQNVDNKLVNLDTRMERAERDLKDVHHELRRGMASMAAMSALVPNSRSTGKTSLSVGTGAYSGHGAVAVGGFHYLTDNLMFNAGAAWSNSRDAVYRVGLTYSF